MAELADRSVLVAGASGGLGAPIARLLAERGARLTLAARDASRLQALGLEATTVAVDLRRAGAADRAVAAAVQAYGGLDGVVTATGVVAFGPALQMPDEVLVELFTINTLAPVRLLRAAAPALQQSAHAGLSPFACMISAVVAEQPVAGMAAYSASKAAVTAFDAAVARELRRSGIRVLDARPPHTETGLASRPVAGQAPALPRGLEPQAVAQRIVTALLDGERDLPAASFS
jgi:cyclic-di-GMP-binding biofilm dispersal mediator protein